MLKLMSPPGISSFGMCSEEASKSSPTWSQLAFDIARDTDLLDSGQAFVEPNQGSKSCLHAAPQLCKAFSKEPAHMCLHL